MATEHEEAVAFYQWTQLKGIPCWHICQEMYTKSWKQKRKQKEEGFKAGLADYLVIIPRDKSRLHVAHMLFIEMKRRKEKGVYPKATDKQKEFVDLVNTVNNVDAKICFGSDEALEYVSQFTKDYKGCFSICPCK